MSGKYIILEGGEGGGKTTQQAHIVNHLKAHGLIVVDTKEPGGTTGAEALRAALLNKEHQFDATTELLAMYAARRDHLMKVVKPALDAGYWVVSDRGWPSSYAYQGPLVDQALLGFLQEKVVPDELWGDLILYLKVNPIRGLSRAHHRNMETGNRQTAFDDRDLEFHQQVLEQYDHLAAESTAWVTIDADKPTEAVKAQILPIIDELIAIEEQF